MSRLTLIIGLFVLACLWIASGCSAARIRPAAEVVTLPDASLESGRVLFNQKCGSCHPGGRSAVGPAIINKPLPKFLVRWQIRHGLGVMPAFKDGVLTDAEVRDIADYVAYLRKQAQRPG